DDQGEGRAGGLGGGRDRTGGGATAPSAHAALEDIERLERALERATSGGTLDDVLNRRLQSLAAKWAAPGGPSDGDDEADALESATADELFKMIDGEFGGTS
ncbi:hypothetical protein ABZ351_37830, partial [Streptomyces microflavus]